MRLCKRTSDLESFHVNQFPFLDCASGSRIVPDQQVFALWRGHGIPPSLKGFATNGQSELLVWFNSGRVQDQFVRRDNYEFAASL